MAELLTLPSRPCRTEDGVFHPSEMLTAEYDDEEMAVMRALREGGHIDEMAALHEAKALLGARIAPEQAELATNDLRPSEAEALSLFDDLEAKNPDFKVPDGVRRMFGEVVPEPDMRDPEPPAWSTAPLPSPDSNRIGKFHAPDAGAPRTEREAAILAYPNSGTARRRVLDQIAASTAGATDEEISLALDMRLYTAAPRRNELLNDGWIRDSGRTRPTTTGTQAVVWVLTDRGRSEWRAAS